MRAFMNPLDRLNVLARLSFFFSSNRDFVSFFGRAWTPPFPLELSSSSAWIPSYYSYVHRFPTQVAQLVSPSPIGPFLLPSHSEPFFLPNLDLPFLLFWSFFLESILAPKGFPSFGLWLLYLLLFAWRNYCKISRTLPMVFSIDSSL